MAINNLKTWMNENRDGFFKKYPVPNATKARRTWKNAGRFLNNALEGDLVGGERGHADSEKTAGCFLKQLKIYM